jgi:hypothetical protein
MKRSKNKKQKYLKGNQKIQFVKVNLSHIDQGRHSRFTARVL